MKKVSLRELPHEGVSHDPQIAKQVLLRRGDVPHLNAFSRATLAPGQSARSHQHPDMFEVFWVEAGVGRMQTADDEHQLAHGVCIVVEPGETHQITNTGSSDLALLYFSVAA
jgi:mannose-6-phosphate isomerase-like protein (cupin superfamily)